MLSMTDCLRSRYLFHRAILDAGFNTGQAVIATTVLFGPEPDDDVTTAPIADDPDELPPLVLTPDPDDDFEELDPEFQPAEEDLEDYLAWSDRLSASMPWPAEYSGYVSDRDIMVLQGGAG